MNARSEIVRLFKSLSEDEKGFVLEWIFRSILTPPKRI